jgi:hypothetical protein
MIDLIPLDYWSIRDTSGDMEWSKEAVGHEYIAVKAREVNVELRAPRGEYLNHSGQRNQS